LKNADARRAVADAYWRLGDRGLIVGSSGNVSVRTRKGMAITPSGGNPNDSGPETMAVTTLDGVVSGKATPSSEWAMHAAIYRLKSDASCIVHTHSDACTALASLNQPLLGFHYMVLRFGGNDVPCAPYVTFGTDSLAEAAAAALADRSACLLGNHGMILHAGNVDTAVADAVLLETLCRQYLLALSAGTPRLLTPDEMDAARERFKSYGPGRANR
jgi:L-fuculose-phosphate aldolase